MSERYLKRKSIVWWQRLLLLFFTLHSSLFTLQAQIGTWQNHLAYHDIQDIRKAGDQLFVRASNGLYQYNLNDKSIITYDKTNGLSDTHIAHIAWSSQAQRLIIVYANSNIDLLETDGDVINIASLYNKTMTENKQVSYVGIEGIYAYLRTSFGVLKVNMQRAEISDTYTPSHPEYPDSLPVTSRTDFEQYFSEVSTLQPDGPHYNHFYKARFLNGKLYTVGGYFLPNTPDPDHPGIIQVKNGSDWQVYEEEINSTTGYAYRDLSAIDVDPKDENHVFVGGRSGLYEFLNGQLLHYYNKDNSPLKGANDRGQELGNDYVLVLGLKFDAEGHLWVLNSQARDVSLLELTPDHQWIDHHQALLADESGISFPGLTDIIIDSRGYLWFVNNNWIHPALFCYDPSSEQLIRYDNIQNQDAIRYTFNWIYCVQEDAEGNIWMGTDQGPFMISATEVGQEQPTFQQIKVPRNDGTNYADYLLNGVTITDMAVDGANRKWFATSGAGVFLISADNMQQLQNFTKENSKLLDNNISAVTIQHDSGEVYFLSDSGLSSYFSDATKPNEEMTSDNVYAYPNPVTPDYTGPITITGLSFDADVKIVAPSGALIKQGRSNGGMFTWDGCDQKGRRVASGVYMVLTATSDGKKGTVCKIAVIN